MAVEVPEVDCDDVDMCEGTEREAKIRSILAPVQASEKLEAFVRDFLGGLDGTFVPPTYEPVKVQLEDAKITAQRRVSAAAGRRASLVAKAVRWGGLKIREFKQLRDDLFRAADKADADEVAPLGPGPAAKDGKTPNQKKSEMADATTTTATKDKVVVPSSLEVGWPTFSRKRRTI